MACTLLNSPDARKEWALAGKLMLNNTPHQLMTFLSSCDVRANNPHSYEKAIF